MVKVSETFGVDLTLQYYMEVVLSFWAPLLHFSVSRSYTLCIGGHFKTYPIFK